MTNMFDPYRNVVHLGSLNCGGEFTLCGLAEARDKEILKLKGENK